MATYLITGGAGFIGSHVAGRLVQMGSTVRVLDNLSSGTLNNLLPWIHDIEFVEGDIRDRATVREVTAGVDYILHTAALRSVPQSLTYPQEYHDVNVMGTINLLVAAGTARVRKVVFSSSCAVYGESTQQPLTEDSTTSGMSPYSLTKKHAEEYCRLFAQVYTVPSVCLRYFNVFGPRQSTAGEYAVVIPKFIQCLLHDDPLPIYGDGTQTRDFVFVDNVVDANLAACASPLSSGEAINVGNGHPCSISQLAEMIAKILQMPCQVHFLPQRPGDARQSYADVTRLCTLLHMIPRVNFRDGLEQTVRWYQALYAR